MKKHIKPASFICLVFILNFSCSQKNEKNDELGNVYPWCIVAFDSLGRSPEERIVMLKEFGFTKYAYDWRDSHLNEMAEEIELARTNEIEIISVWLWLNAKQDSLGKLSPSNEKIFEILNETQLKTTIWLSFSNNFFEELTHEQALETALEMIDFIQNKAEKTNCKIALYNHKGWFGEMKNQLEIIESLEEDSISIVYNFHHAHQDLEEFPEILKKISPHLSAVNLNGMNKGGPKILTLGEGEFEKKMIETLLSYGYDGPWGILGHIEDEDVAKVIDRNLKGYKSLLIQQNKLE